MTSPQSSTPDPADDSASGCRREADAGALAQLMERLYGDLRVIAERHLLDERRGHTLQPTALVHEAYMRLLEQRDVTWRNPAQALGLAAQAMRRILVDHARARATAKRGGSHERLALDRVDTPAPERPVDVLHLEEALTALAQVSPQRAQIVELRFFAGLTNEQVAEATGIPRRTVDREWAVAKAWLFVRMNG